jgi:hypothetical protein
MNGRSAENVRCLDLRCDEAGCCTTEAGGGS